MKFLVLLLVLVVAYMFWRNARLEDKRGGSGAAQPKAPPAGRPDEMVQCPVCSVHLPRADAVAGANGLLYCSPEHRHSAGG